MRHLKNFTFFVLFTLIIFIIVLKTPENIFFSKKGNRVETDTLILIIVFILPLVIVPILFPKRFFVFYIGFISFGMTGYMIGNVYRNNQIEKELELYAISTKGIVKLKKYFSRTKGTGDWEFVCEFIDNNIVYSTFYTRDKLNIISEGDTLNIIYLERNPEISKIIIKKSDY